MSIASDLNRAHSRALAAAKRQGHEMTILFLGQNAYTSYCRTEGCGAYVTTHGLYETEGSAIDYTCDPSEPEDPFAAFEDEDDVIPDEVCA